MEWRRISEKRRSLPAVCVGLLVASIAGSVLVRMYARACLNHISMCLACRTSSPASIAMTTRALHKAINTVALKTWCTYPESLNCPLARASFTFPSPDRPCARNLAEYLTTGFIAKRR